MTSGKPVWQPTYCERCEQRMDLCRCKKEEPVEAAK